MTTAGSVSGQLSGSGINSNADCSEASWTLTWLLRSSNAGLALIAVTPATTAAWWLILLAPGASPGTGGLVVDPFRARYESWNRRLGG